LREKGTRHVELDLDNPKWTGEQLVDPMLVHPIQINWQIVKSHGWPISEPGRAAYHHILSYVPTRAGFGPMADQQLNASGGPR
jgi:hypothetical protein